MAQPAAQATLRRAPIAASIVLWLLGVLLRICCSSAWPQRTAMPLSVSGDVETLASQLAQLHTDNHISIYTLVTFFAQGLGAHATLLGAVSLGCDVAQALAWLVWLRGRSARASSIYLMLWAASPLLVGTATSSGPHAALGLWTSLGLMALWPVWQQQRPSKGAQLWLMMAWGLLVCAHPLGVFAVAAMVLTALAWPKASAQALSNSLNTIVGQAGRLALNIGQPALLAGLAYLGMRLLGHLYPSSEVEGPQGALGIGAIAQVLAAAWGTSGTAALGAWSLSWSAPWAFGVGLTAFFVLAGISHPTGQKLISIAVLYTAALVTYHAVVPVFGAATLVPAWILLLAGAALGLGQAREKILVQLGIGGLALWQAYLWLSVCPLLQLPF